MTRRVLLVAAGAIVVVGCVVAAVWVATADNSGAGGSQPKHARAVVLAASDDFAVYQVATRSTDLNAGDFYGGDLYAVSRSGAKRELTSFDDGPRGVDLVRDTLVQETNHATATSSHYTVHFLDLVSGREGTVTLAPGDAELAAAPGGFVHAYRPSIGTSYGDVLDLEQQSYSGATVQLGTPYPDGRVYEIVAGDSGLVATTSTSDELPNLDATIRYMNWNDPGVWKTIFDPREGDYLSCARPSSTAVACAVSGSGASDSTRFGLITLRTGKVAWLPKAASGGCTRLDYATYGPSLVTIETSNTGGCADGVLIRMTANGSVTKSTARYSGPGSVRAGLGEILVSSGAQRAIEGLADVTARPKLLAAAPAG